MREVLGRHGVAMSEHRLRMFLMTRKLLVTWEYAEGSSLGEVEEKGSPGSVVETGLDFERIEQELGELEVPKATLGEVLAPLLDKLEMIRPKG